MPAYLVRTASARMVPQEHRLSCGAACAKQLLLDDGIPVAEEDVRQRAGFHDGLGIHSGLLGDALTALNPAKTHRGTSVDPDALPALLHRAPFLAMLDAHWVIVDGTTDAGNLRIRDPAPLPAAPLQGTEGEMAREEFDAAWTRGVHQVVYRT